MFRAAAGSLLAFGLAVGVAAALPAPEVEPGSGSGARASLQSVDGRDAVVQVALQALTQPATVTITPQSVDEKGELLGPAGAVRTLELAAGVDAVLAMPVRVTPGAFNHLIFRVDLTRKDGTAGTEALYVPVNLDPRLQPRILGDVVEFPGQEVKP